MSRTKEVSELGLGSNKKLPFYEIGFYGNFAGSSFPKKLNKSYGFV